MDGYAPILDLSLMFIRLGDEVDVESGLNCRHGHRFSVGMEVPVFGDDEQEFGFIVLHVLVFLLRWPGQRRVLSARGCGRGSR